MLATHPDGFVTPSRYALDEAAAAALARAKTVTMHAYKLRPGSVLAEEGPARWRVVTDSRPHSKHTHSLDTIPLMGGVVTNQLLPRGRELTVASLDADDHPRPVRIPLVPPPCPHLTPEPGLGDRIVRQYADALHPDAQLAYRRTQHGWMTIGRHLRSDAHVTAQLSNPSELRNHWFVTIPDGDRPHLYVDGCAHPAVNTLEDLSEEDVIPGPGGARWQFIMLDRARDERTATPWQLTVETLKTSVYPWVNRFAPAVGTQGTWHLAGGSMLPVLARRSSYGPATALRVGDRALDRFGHHVTVIATEPGMLHVRAADGHATQHMHGGQLGEPEAWMRMNRR
jgi:hypothetical protein